MFRRSPGLCLAAAMAAYAALLWLAPKATFIPMAVNALVKAASHSSPFVAVCLHLVAFVIMGAPTITFMAIQIAIVYFFAKLRMNLGQSLLTLLGCLAGVAVILALIIWQSGAVAKMGRYPDLKELMWVMGNYAHPLKTPMFLCIMIAAASIGYMVSLRVRDKNLLLPVVMFAACIDFWTVTHGPVAAMLQNAPEVANAVSAPIPAVGTGAFVPQTLVGPGDTLFMALVFAAVHKLGMNGPRNYWFVFAGMTAGMLAVLFGLVSFLPALIVLAVAVVAANWKQFKLTRQEAISTAIVAVLLFGSLPLVWWALGSNREKPKSAKPAVHIKQRLKDI